MWLEDVRRTFRSFRSSPGFLAVSTLTLAIGIGAGAAIFSIVDQVILKPLPFPESGRIVSFCSYYSQQTMRGAFSPPTLRDYRNRLTSFRSICATHPWNANLTGNGEPERIRAQEVSASFMETLGVTPALGRSFLPEEEQPGRDHVVVLSHLLWKQKFGADPQILGKHIQLNDLPYTVIGIMPAGFNWGMNYGRDTQAALWVPFTLTPERLTEDQRGNEFLDLLGRLKQGVSLEQAEAEAKTLNAALHKQYPNHYQMERGWIFQLRPLKEDMVAEVRPFLMILLLSVGLMFMIACNNVAGLMLLRGARRQREMTIRSALGANRIRLAREILVECLLLAAAGGALGFVFGSVGIRVFTTIAGTTIPRSAEIGLDLRFFASSLAVSLLAGVLSGIVPSIRLTQGLTYEALKEGGRSATQGLRRHRTVNLLVISQIAISIILLVGAGLLFQSFRRILAVKPGFRTGNVLTMTVPLSPARYPVERRSDFLKLVLDRICALPLIKSAAATGSLPMSGEENSSSFYVEGNNSSGRQLPEAENWVVTSGYFQTMGIPILKGRGFTNDDTATSAPVVVIDEVMARRYWPDSNPIGRRLDFKGDDSNHEWCEIVGIVGQVKHRGMEDISRPEFYVPYPQFPLRTMSFVVQTSGDPGQAAASVRQAVYAADANQPVYRVGSMEQLISVSLTQRRIVAMLMSGFALFALFLSGLGLFAVLASTVADRTQEIGIRMILGAISTDVVKLIFGHIFKLTAAGILLGLAGTMATSPLLQTLLFQVKTRDPQTFGLVAVLVALVAATASYLPMRRAIRIEPVTSLKYE